MSAEELGHALRQRFPKAPAELEGDLTTCEEASRDETLEPRKALALVGALSSHGEALEAAARARSERMVHG